MNTYATPENFKPGERWLVKDNEFSRELCEVRCLEWSPSGIRCKFEYVNSGSRNWSDTTHWYLVERLPDESKVDKTAEPARTVENDSELCQREDCRAIRQELTQRIIHEAAQEIAQGKTFTVATSEEITPSNKLD